MKMKFGDKDTVSKKSTNMMRHSEEIETSNQYLMVVLVVCRITDMLSPSANSRM